LQLGAVKVALEKAKAAGKRAPGLGIAAAPPPLYTAAAAAAAAAAAVAARVVEGPGFT
jgi:hypothetical protein